VPRLTEATRRSTANLRAARKNLKSAISRAKSKWIEDDVCSKVNNKENIRQGTTKNYWDSIKLLKRGMNKTTSNKAK